jgi:hypothetical protein
MLIYNQRETTIRLSLSKSGYDQNYHPSTRSVLQSENFSEDSYAKNYSVSFLKTVFAD